MKGLPIDKYLPNNLSIHQAITETRLKLQDIYRMSSSADKFYCLTDEEVIALV